LLSESVLFLLF